MVNERKIGGMKKFFVNLFVAWLTVQTGAEELDWMTSIPEAQKKAKEEKKVVLVDFSGSDWCGWCMKMQREVFDTKEFQDYAKTNLVLVQIDFPMHKEQSEDLKNTNAALHAKYGVQSFPTFIIMDGDGRELGQLGYFPGGPHPFITRLSKFKRKAVL